jgi:predicted dehydrogenase
VRTLIAVLASLGLLAALSSAAEPPGAADEKPLRLAIAGLVHGHVQGFLRAAKDRHGVAIVGIADPDAALHRKYAARHALADDLFFTDLETMLERVKPEAVAAFTSTYDHPQVVEACARRHVHVMMEKPLAVSIEHARRLQRAAAASGIHVIVNYETTWYRSHGALWKLINDFGCYGGNLMTWLMGGQPPLSVTALTQRIKPAIYPHVDDEATVLLEYPRAQGIIQASWNWPFNRKDLDVYGEKGYARAVGGSVLRVRRPGQTDEEALTPAELPADERDSLSYLAAVVRGRLKPSGLSSLEHNLVVTEILEAARESARTGKAVRIAIPSP